MIVTLEQVIQTLSNHRGEFAEVRNPAFVFPEVEYYPLAPKVHQLPAIKAVMMDMDGTTTTTEVLCIYSLEQMVRRMSGLTDKSQWEGLDHNADLPFIIGNSTTRHVEYLITKYLPLLKPQLIAKAFSEAAWWTLNYGQDAQRKTEVIQNLRKTGLEQAAKDLASADSPIDFSSVLMPLLNLPDFSMLVGLAIDIYYETYHRILSMLRQGGTTQVRQMVFGHAQAQAHLISPMPGITFMLPLLKGWLGDEAHLLAPVLLEDYVRNTARIIDGPHKDRVLKSVNNLSLKFESQPAKLGLVTSSIFYEADIVIREVMKVMSQTISQSDLSASRKQHITEACSNYHLWYDAFVTASDSNEIRLKPHRDLYSIALHKAGLLPTDFNQVIGFEDSQSGTLAIRASGIGCCVAVPFAQTKGHDFAAATHIASGGIPEVIIDHQLYLKKP